MKRRAFLAILLLTLANPAWAVKPGEILPDPQLEARARALSAQLRCLVCQNQSIDDSDAELAADLRQIVRERIMAGDSDPAIVQYLVARYGDFILLKPPFNAETLLLWATPLLALALGGFAMWRAGRRRSAGEEEVVPLSAGEQENLARMVVGGE